MLRTTDKLWHRLIGSTSEFPLERRIFHSIGICLIILMAIYTPYNFYAGLYIASLSALVIALLIFYQYYQSRFRGQPHSNLVFGLTGLVIFAVNYFTNSGIHGSTDIIWPVYLLLVFAIAPYSQHISWLLAYILCFFAIHTVEYYFPHLIRYPFTLGKGQYLDRITAFPAPAIAIFIIIRYLRRSYDQERKAAEEKALAVEISNIEKTKLMSIISHDVRTPLINIQSYLELLQDTSFDDAERKKIEKLLLDSTTNTVELLSNLLHWSKSQMDAAQVNLQKINLRVTLGSTLEMARQHALSKQISLSCDIDGELNVLADADMLQLVIRNLLSNAVKFTPPGGSITIIGAMVSEECVISIQDTGAGIPLELQPTVFSMKSQPTQGTNDEKGVGLGLILCKEYIERQGGRISFVSGPSSGSVFYVYLPLWA